MEKAYLILEDGHVFEGVPFGKKGAALGEVVFTTAMTGYLETLTDKSYAGQIIVQTFPLIGNYGVIPEDFESDLAAGEGVVAKGYVVREWCRQPSNFRSAGCLDEFLADAGVAGLCGIDTRALTKLIRTRGVLNGAIAPRPDAITPEELRAYRVRDAVAAVSRKTILDIPPAAGSAGAAGKTNPAPKPEKPVALLDFGLKTNILRELANRDCAVRVFPHNTPAGEILAQAPQGVMLSNGPGDPAENHGVIAEIQKLLQARVPLFGICLGHQLMALASGFKTEKLKFGHRGANQPVRDLETGKVYITSQNHGYAVVRSSIDPSLAAEVFVNVNDATSEGLRYVKAPAFSVQFHPEAHGGPLDPGFLFDQFIALMEGYHAS
jgi:carbamoyl-phosphate synthase small subunit